jgi:hypothetical protein
MGILRARTIGSTALERPFRQQAQRCPLARARGLCRRAYRARYSAAAV